LTENASVPSPERRTPPQFLKWTPGQALGREEIPIRRSGRPLKNREKMKLRRIFELTVLAEEGMEFIYLASKS